VNVDVVMPGLVPGIHVLDSSRKKDVDGRDQPGHDEGNFKFAVLDKYTG
jgi:hypothetical protein